MLPVDYKTGTVVKGDSGMQVVAAVGDLIADVMIWLDKEARVRISKKYAKEIKFIKNSINLTTLELESTLYRQNTHTPTSADIEKVIADILLWMETMPLLFKLDGRTSNEKTTLVPSDVLKSDIMKSLKKESSKLYTILYNKKNANKATPGNIDVAQIDLQLSILQSINTNADSYYKKLKSLLPPTKNEITVKELQSFRGREYLENESTNLDKIKKKYVEFMKAHDNPQVEALYPHMIGRANYLSTTLSLFRIYLMNIDNLVKDADLFGYTGNKDEKAALAKKIYDTLIKLDITICATEPELEWQKIFIGDEVAKDKHLEFLANVAKFVGLDYNEIHQNAYKMIPDEILLWFRNAKLNGESHTDISASETTNEYTEIPEPPSELELKDLIDSYLRGHEITPEMVICRPADFGFTSEVNMKQFKIEASLVEQIIISTIEPSQDTQNISEVKTNRLNYIKPLASAIALLLETHRVNTGSMKIDDGIPINDNLLTLLITQIAKNGYTLPDSSAHHLFIFETNTFFNIDNPTQYQWKDKAEDGRIDELVDFIWNRSNIVFPTFISEKIDSMRKHIQ